MANQVVSPLQRRARTAPAKNPPTIALHISQVSAALTAARTLTACCDALPYATLVPQLSGLLEQSAIVNLQATVIDELAAEVAAHSCPSTTIDLASTTAALTAAWSSATTAPLEDVIRAATDAGIDGELLCWHIISLESVKHVGLIRKEASKIVRKLPHTAPDDLMGYGWSGLRAALRAYDPDLGFAFSTYACPKINGAIRDGIRGESPLPKRLTTLARSASAAEEILTQQLSRSPTYAEITEYLDAGAHAALLPRLGTAASLDELTDPWRESAREPSCLVDVSDPGEEAWRRMQVDAVHSALSNLPSDQADLIRMVYLEGNSLAETARATGRDIKDLRKMKRHAMTLLSADLEQWRTPVSA